MLIYFISGSGDENDISVKSMNTIKQCGYLYLDSMHQYSVFFSTNKYSLFSIMNNFNWSKFYKHSKCLFSKIIADSGLSGTKNLITNFNPLNKHWFIK